MKAMLALLICSTVIAAAQDQTGGPAPRISAAMAATSINQGVVVTAKVAQVTMRDKLVYVNLDKPYPQTPLTYVVFAKNTNLFDLQSLKGKQVEITGKVTEYNSKPQIVLNMKSQLKVVEPGRHK